MADLDHIDNGPPRTEPMRIPSDTAKIVTEELHKYDGRLQDHAGPQLVALLSLDLASVTPEIARELVHSRMTSGKYDHFLKPQATSSNSGNAGGNSGSGDVPFEGFDPSKPGHQAMKHYLDQKAAYRAAGGFEAQGLGPVSH